MARLVFDDLVLKVGGKFRLSVLVQKRLKELMRGAKPLVDIRTDDKLEIIFEEINQGKIELVSEEEALAYIRELQKKEEKES